MKKSLLALSILSMFAGVASAQTSVVIYGSIDGGVRDLNHVAITPTTTGTKLSMGSNGTFNSNRLGFRGTEDLGGGMNAHFLLETGFNSGTGAFDGTAGSVTPTRIFNRGAFVGLGGTWGALDLGQQYTVVFKTMLGYEPFGYNYPGIVPVIAASGGNTLLSNNVSRFSNDVQYTGDFGPIKVRAEHSFGEVAGDTRANSANGVGATYAAGPFSVGSAYIRRTDNSTVNPLLAAGTTADYNVFTVGGAYTFGPARLTAGYNKQKQQNGGILADTNTRLTWVGLNYDFTPLFQLTGAYYRTNVSAQAGSGKTDFYIVGAKYLLSKRTNFYADIDSKKLGGISRINASSLFPQDSQTGVSIGVNHNF